MKEMTIEAVIENVPLVTDWVNEELEARGCPNKIQMQIDVAIDELFSNISNYAYNPKTGSATVRMEVEEKPLSVSITFIDNGIPYNPLAREEPDIKKKASDDIIGGLGIMLVRKMMDDVIYEYKNGQNILTIVKKMEE